MVRGEGLQRWEATRAKLLHLPEYQRRELPFAEFLHQRVLAGGSPDDAWAAYHNYRHGWPEEVKSDTEPWAGMS